MKKLSEIKIGTKQLVRSAIAGLGLVVTAALLSTTLVAEQAPLTGVVADEAVPEQAASAQAASAQAKAEEPSLDAIKTNIKRIFPQAAINNIIATPVDNIYQIDLSNGQIFHVTGDGRYVLTGELLEVMTAPNSTMPIGLFNHTEQFENGKRKEILTTIDRTELVSYPTKGEKKAEVFVFTDTDCIYCRKFHAEIPKMNSLGVEVSYLAWPRAGLGSKTGKQMVDIWCSKNRQTAMDKAKTGGKVTSVGKLTDSEKGACSGVVSKQMALGSQLGVRGTPAVFLSDGSQIGGYLRAEELAKRLKSQ